jgi:hypothetical protein
MFHAAPSFYIGLRTIGTLFQFLHHLSIGTTIQPHHKHHRNRNEPYNEPQNPVPKATIQNKQQNLKTQTKPKQPEDLKGELKDCLPPPMGGVRNIPMTFVEDLRGELKLGPQL